MKIIHLIYIVALVCRCYVLATENKTEEESQTKSYHMSDRVYTCSSWLSTLISNFCDNVYKIVKRDTSIMIDKLAPPSLQQQRNKERLLVEESWRRVRRQIASECCEKPCTVADVIAYCPDDAKLLKERPDIFNYI